MKIYNLSNGIYTGMESEYNGKVPPYNTTDVTPPEDRDGFDRKFDNKTKTWSYIENVPVIVPQPTLEEVKATKVQEIVAGSNQYTSLVKGRYSELEIDSWAVQAEQSQVVLSGGTLPEDALLCVLATANKVTLEEFAMRVMGNVAQADELTKLIVSQQQAMEARIKAAITVEEVESIQVLYQLPQTA